MIQKGDKLTIVRNRPIAMVLTVLALTGCPPSPLRPSIKVVSNLGNPNSLTISGSGFANISHCAALSLTGLVNQGQYGTVAVGEPGCSGGAFQNFNWPYSLVGPACVPNSTQDAGVLAIDTQLTTAGASAGVTIPWGSNCAIGAACGQNGQPTCPGETCSPGLVLGSDGRCSPCGVEGAPVCAGGACAGTDLHVTFAGGQLVCTWTCGHAPGAACPSPGLPGCSGNPPTLTLPQNACETPVTGSNLSNGGIFSCFDNGMIDTSCLCVPNNLNTCPVSTSIPKNADNYGVCSLGKFAYASTSGSTYGPTCP